MTDRLREEVQRESKLAVAELSVVVDESCAYWKKMVDVVDQEGHHGLY